MPRPRLNPTDEQRKKVKSLAAMGIPHEVIARQVGVRSPKTLRKHYREELDFGVVEANATIVAALFSKAKDGDVGALKFWLINRAGWRPEPRYGPGTSDPPPFIVAMDVGVKP